LSGRYGWSKTLEMLRKAFIRTSSFI
jgi:hypothetical protein